MNKYITIKDAEKFANGIRPIKRNRLDGSKSMESDKKHSFTVIIKPSKEYKEVLRLIRLITFKATIKR